MGLTLLFHHLNSHRDACSYLEYLATVPSYSRLYAQGYRLWFETSFLPVKDWKNALYSMVTFMGHHIDRCERHFLRAPRLEVCFGSSSVGGVPVAQGPAGSATILTLDPG